MAAPRPEHAHASAHAAAAAVMGLGFDREGTGPANFQKTRQFFPFLRSLRHVLCFSFASFKSLS
jgi:hypothetical protein